MQLFWKLMIRHKHYNHSHGKAFFPGVLLLMAICLTLSCKQRGLQGQMDGAALTRFSILARESRSIS